MVRDDDHVNPRLHKGGVVTTLPLRIFFQAAETLLVSATKLAAANSGVILCGHFSEKNDHPTLA